MCKFSLPVVPEAATADEVIHMMEYYLEHGDPDIDYLHLSYF